MASSTSPNIPSTSANDTCTPSMSGIKPRFIGAVEDEWELYSDRSSDYTIGASIGFGASSIVYSALYNPATSDSSVKPSKPIPCALKVLDLDSLAPRSLQLLQRETTLMSLSKHPNVLRVRGSWMDGHKLYIALRLMNKGSAADVMRYGWPGGMEEDVCRCILAQALKGLNYLHINGFIHRDVKAANLLIDDDGTVLLGDLGVAADLTEDSSLSTTTSSSVTATAALTQSQSTQDIKHGPRTGKRTVAFDLSKPKMGKRKSFVGTPCWMAPELIQGRQYDSSADIWSFGITALELTQGRPPKSRESPQSVLLRTIQDDPPSLNREGGTYKYSRTFKEVVDSCLVKEPSERPTAEELLQTPFFKAAKKTSYLVNAILKDLPPLTQRQERRIAKTHHTLHSLDSWDFNTTVHSPTSSVYRRKALEDMVAAEREADTNQAEGVFEMEEERERWRTNERREVDHSSRAHSANVSFAEEPIMEWVEDTVEPTSASPTAYQTFIPNLDPASESSSPSPPPSPSTAPSSFPDSLPIHDKHETAALTPAPTLSPAQAPKATKGTAVIGTKTPETATEGQATITETQDVTKTPEVPTEAPETVTAARPESRPSIAPTSGNPRSLWRKFKSNVRRPSSRGGPTSDDKPATENTQTAEEKGSLKSSKSKLSRPANMTAHAVGLKRGK
ncbi:kinase-like domain-containing protein [Crucibulum laeve]|uniref:Kinase-like domain-containing protein n=1 Tax=Crucibulum laeve TaxID=68775 RepID=A0A5C3M8W3_9AGAR|nr:kinase-like domain-containing protein [Crucibulum laeve]